MDEIMGRAVDLVVSERQRQKEKWGDESGNHPFEWMSILMEEVGELAEATNETCFHSAHAKPELGGTTAILREAVQVAAVALAIAEAVLQQDDTVAEAADPAGQWADNPTMREA